MTIRKQVHTWVIAGTAMLVTVAGPMPGPTCAMTINQTAKLLANDGAANDLFGFSVGISGNTVIVGALGDDDNGEQSGAAYLFNTTTGNQIGKLLANDGILGDEFGTSVGISGTTVVVGVPRDGDNGAFLRIGIFIRYYHREPNC